ncbi:hypothetical protein GC177_02820 [bacterium]|nr:hypothetical protein [bacterium]
MNERLIHGSPYPFAPFLALTPMQAAFLFQELGYHMVYRHAGAPSIHRAGDEAMDANHLVDIHNLGRMGAIGLWQHVNQQRMSAASRELVQRCDDACKTYSMMMGEAMDWWAGALREKGIAVDRRSSVTFKERYHDLQWGGNDSHDRTGFLAAMQWRAGRNLPKQDEEMLRQALPDDGGAYAARLDELQHEIQKAADLLASPDCPLSHEPLIGFLARDGKELTIPNSDGYLTRLYCLNRIAYGLNDSRSHHPLLIPSLKLHSKEAVDAALRLGECDSLMAETSLTEHYRAMMNPGLTGGSESPDVFAQSKAKAWQKLSALSRTDDERLDYSAVFVRDYPRQTDFYDYMDWLLVGRAMESYENLPNYLKPLAAYMENLRQDGQDIRQP